MSDQENPQENDQGRAFEQALTCALRPVQPPETLAKFLAIAAEAEEHQRRTSRSQARRWFRPATGGLSFLNPWPRAFVGGALTAALMLGAFVAEQAHRRHEQAEATQEFATSMRVTDEAIQHTREQLMRAGVPLDQ
jgi:hypothetical protein